MNVPKGFVYHHSDGQLVPDCRVVHVYVNPITGEKWGYWVPASYREAMRASWHEPRRTKAT